MLFHSTRGKDTDKDFATILMQGLAEDGGLFMPEYWTKVELAEIKSKKSFVEVAQCVVPLFTSSSFAHEETMRIVESNWHDFEHKNLIGIKKLNYVSVLEIFHGHTEAFKVNGRN